MPTLHQAHDVLVARRSGSRARWWVPARVQVIAGDGAGNGGKIIIPAGWAARAAQLRPDSAERRGARSILLTLQCSVFFSSLLPSPLDIRRGQTPTGVRLGPSFKVRVSRLLEVSNCNAGGSFLLPLRSSFARRKHSARLGVSFTLSAVSYRGEPPCLVA